MAKYDLLQSILPYLEAYERSHPKVHNPQHFAVWLARQTTETDQLAGHETNPSAREMEDATISRLFTFLTRYRRIYARKALEGSVLGTIDEFAYLATLLEQGQITKTDLIQRNRHEKPTGMEIIRRLMVLHLVIQRDDLDDRRSKRLTITPEGTAAFSQVAARMGQVSRLLTGSLNTAEKMLLLQLLEKLETFHQVVLAKAKSSDWLSVVGDK